MGRRCRFSVFLPAPDLPQRPPDLRLLGVDLQGLPEGLGGAFAVSDAEAGQADGGEGEGVAGIVTGGALEIA